MGRVLILYYICMEEGTIPENPGNQSQNTNPVSSWLPESPVPQDSQLPNQFPAPGGPIPQTIPQMSPPSGAPPLPSSSPENVPVDNGDGFFSKHSKLIKIGFILLAVLTILFIFISLIMPKFKNPRNELVTLTYWGLWEDQSVMAPVIAGFEKENPSIKINYLVQEPIEYRDKLSIRIPNGNGPDIFRFHNTWYPMFKNFLLPLPKETIERKEFEDNYYSVAQNDLIKNGAVYGIPLEIDTLVLFLNTQIFDSASQEQGSEILAPVTWQDFIDSSQTLTKRNEEGGIDIAGAAIGTFENVNHAPDILSLLFAQNGVDTNDIGVSGSESRVSDALRFYTNFALLENNVWDQTLENSTKAFSQGKLAMYFGYARDYSVIKSLSPNLSIKLIPVPQLLSEKKANIASYWVEGVSSKSLHQKEALLFMKYLAKPETQEEIYKEESKTKPFGRPYSNKNLTDKLKGSGEFIFVDQASNAVSSPFVDETYDNGLNDKLNSYLKDVINSILSGESEESAAGTLFQGYSEVIQEYESGTESTDN